MYSVIPDLHPYEQLCINEKALTFYTEAGRSWLLDQGSAKYYYINISNFNRCAATVIVKVKYIWAYIQVPVPLRDL